jgi:hypothetical protein
VEAQVSRRWIPALLFLVAALVPPAALLGVGIWLLLDGRTLFGWSLIAAAVIIEVAERLWLRFVRSLL